MSLEGDIFAVRWGTPWLALPIGLFGVADVRARAGRAGVASWELLALRRDREPMVLLGPPCVGLNYADLAETAGHLARLLGVPQR